MKAVVLTAVLVLGACASEAEDPLLVAAASDLRPAFDELAEHTDAPIRFVYGSSGQLAQQIIEGAPFDVYASANVEFVDRVLDAGRGDPDTKATYAFGRIVIWTRSGEAATELADLTDPRFDSIAIANPTHAPYGTAAAQALRSEGLYDVLAGRLVFGENISDTLRLVATGNADAGLVALSLAIAHEDGTWTLVAEDLHRPLEQALVVTAEDPERARAAGAFVDLVSSPPGRDVMRRYGFLLPGEDPPASWEGS